MKIKTSQLSHFTVAGDGWAMRKASTLDSNSLIIFLSPFSCPKSVATYQGIVTSDHAAVYNNFTNTQKCWAHLLRKAIKLTLLAPKNKKYAEFADGLLQIFYDARDVHRNLELSKSERNTAIFKLDDRSRSGQVPLSGYPARP